MASALEMRAKRHDISLKMRELLSSTAPSAQAEWKALDEQQEGWRVKIEAQERQTGLETELNSVRGVPRPRIGNEEELSQMATPDLLRRSAPSFKRDFDVYLRTGVQSAEIRALGAAAGADGATLVPAGFEMDLEATMKYFGGIQNIARTITTSTGNPLAWPTLSDESNTGEWLAEAAAIGTADPTFGVVNFGANLLSSKLVKVSVQLEQDAAFDIAGLLSTAFGERLGRSLDTALWTGDGSTVPVTGLLTALQAATGRSVLAVGANANDGVSNSLNSIGTDDFSALIDKLDRAYQKPTNKFVFAQSTQNALRKLKDKYGRPVWETSLAQGEPDTIFGYGFQIDNALASIGAGNITAAFGDFSKYVLRRVAGFTLIRLNELYMANLQRGYIAFMRLDAKLLQAKAFSYLTHPLS
jgi:HK97 family phage major capsid protein